MKSYLHSPSHDISVQLQQIQSLISSNPESALERIDALHSMLDSEHNYQVVCDTLYRIAGLYHLLKLPDKIIPIFDNIFTLCKQYHDDERYMFHKQNLATFYYLSGNFDKAFSVIFSLIQEYDSHTYSELYPRAFLILSGISKQQGDINNSQKYAQQAIAFATKNGHIGVEFEAREVLAAIFSFLGQYNQAIEQLSQVYLHPYCKTDERCFLGVCSALSELYSDTQQPTKALELAMEGLCVPMHLESMHNHAKLHSNAGRAYAAMGNYSAALREYMFSKKIRTDLGDNAGIILITLRLAKLYYQVGEYHEALRFSQEVLGDSKKYTIALYEPYAHLLIGESYIQLHQTDQALVYFETSYRIFLERNLLKEITRENRHRLFEGLIKIHSQLGNRVQSHKFRNELQSLLAETIDQQDENRDAIYEFDVQRNKVTFKTMGMPSIIIPQSIQKSEKSKSPDIQVRVLGRFYVEVNGKEITSEQWKRKRSRDIFKYMVLNYKQTLSVEKIVDTFWGYNAPENAVNIVWNAVSVIRSILEPDMPKGIPSSYIIAADKSYTLDFGDKGIIDCCEFLHYVTQAQRCTNEYESIELIEKALSYYGGDLLPEDIYEEWTHAIREDYKSHYILGCLQCSAYYAEVHNYDLSISYAKKVIAIDNTYRKAYEILVKVCKENGNTTEAGNIIAQCKTYYKKEYGEQPPAWLDQLEHSLTFTA